MSLRLGYKASAEQFGPNELLDFSVHAEKRGFDSVFISDHFQPWRHTGGHAPFSLAWLGALGARTSRIAFGTSVLTPSFRYHPSVVAQAFATLGVMFPKRVILGLGSGESLNEVPASGLAWPEPKERTARLKESVTLIRQLWSESRVSFQGQYYRTEKATIYDKPEQQVPIYVAAAGPVMAKYAGQVGDGFICTSGKAPELYRDTLLPNVAAGNKASGRDPPGLRHDDRDEGVLRYRPPARDGRYPALGCVSAFSRRKRPQSKIRSRWNGSPTRCRPNGAADSLDRVDRSRRARREDPAVCGNGLPPSRVSRPGHRSGTIPQSVFRAGSAAPEESLRLSA